MKKKTKQVTEFIDGLCSAITSSPLLRKNTVGDKTEQQMQTEIRPIILRYLERHFEAAGFKDPEAKAHESFYWEGQEGKYGRKRNQTFAARNYPDFIITKPYLLAIEYKKSDNGSVIKQGIGQSVMHTLSEDFDYVFYLFHDQCKDKCIAKSAQGKRESNIIDTMWQQFNVFVRVI